MLTRSKNQNVEPISTAENNEEPPAEAIKEAAKNIDDLPLQSGKPTTAPETERQQIELVKKYYKQIGFSGSFAGIQSLQRALWSDKGLDISQKIISKAMHEVSSKQIHSVL